MTFAGMLYVLAISIKRYNNNIGVMLLSNIKIKGHAIPAKTTDQAKLRGNINLMCTSLRGRLQQG